MVIGKRAMLVTFIIAAIGLAACVVRTAPVHRQHRPVAEKHKKQKPVKHKKQKHKGHGDDD